MKQRLLMGAAPGDGSSRYVQERGSSLFIKRVADLEKSENGGSGSGGGKGNSGLLDSEASPF